MTKKNVAIVGATGQVGTVIQRLLAERDFPVGELRLYASARSSGKVIQWGGQDYTVEDVDTADISNIDIAFFSAGGSASLQHAPRFASQGAIVIDNSSAWRMDPEVPLVVPEVNVEAMLSIPKGIIANPNCTTMAAMPILKPLDEFAGLSRLTLSTYQAVSGAGLAGVEELHRQIVDLVDDHSAFTYGGLDFPISKADVFPEPIAFNVLPMAGTVDSETGETSEEEKLRNEGRKILGLPELKVSGTCVRVPVYTGHSLSINAEFRRPISIAQATTILGSAEGVALSEIPSPHIAVGNNLSYVGRIRQDSTVDHGLAFFVCGDNLLKGAALNAIQIAEKLIRS